MAADALVPWWRGRRGEWYLVAQIVTLTLVFAGPFVIGRGTRWPAEWHRSLRVAGLVMIAAGLALGLAGVVRLRKSLSALAMPLARATLVTSGVFSLVRHPIYGGLTLMTIGWALAIGGWLTLTSSALAIVVLYLKSGREERLLSARFPDYAAYRRRTRRFLPYIV